MGPGPRPAVQNRPGRSGSLTRGPGHSPLWAPPSQPVPSALERGRCAAGLVQTQRSRRTPPSQERWQLVLRPGWLGARSQLCRRVGSDSAGRAPGGLTRLRLGPRKVSGPPRPPRKPPVQPDGAGSLCAPDVPAAPPGDALSCFRNASPPRPQVLVSSGGPGGRAGGPRGPEAPPTLPGNPTPKGRVAETGSGRPACPSLLGPPSTRAGFSAPTRLSAGLRRCPHAPGPAPPVALCSGLGHACSAPRSPAGPRESQARATRA